MIEIEKKTDWKNLITIIIILLCIFVWAFFTFDYRVTFDNRPENLRVVLPSNAVSGSSFNFTVMAWDWAERVSTSYKGTITFRIFSYCPDTLRPLNLQNVDVKLPEISTFSGANFNTGLIPFTWFSNFSHKDYGKKSFEIEINTPGIHYIMVRDKEGRNALSNPVLVTEEAPDTRLIWGDIHNHTILSDGSGMPDYLLHYARDYALIDFVSITDHGEMIISSRPRPAWMIDCVASATEEFNAPGEFIALHGVEWTTNYGLQRELGFGHYAIVTDGNKPMEIARTIQKNPEKLWNYLDKYCEENNASALAIPHHLTQTNYEMDWAGINPEYVKAVEVYSVHGEGLLPPDHPENNLGMIRVKHEPSPGASAACAFRMGHRPALVANSDSHDGHPGHSLSHSAGHYPEQWPLSLSGWDASQPYRGGMTGAWVRDFSRKGVIEAFHEGGVMGVTAPYRPIVNFTVNGVKPGMQGNTVKVPAPETEREIFIYIARDGLETLEEDWSELTVELWKNSELWHTETTNQPLKSFLIHDDSIISGTEYKDFVIDEKDNYYLHERALLTVNPDKLNTGGADYYFLRLHSKSGFYAWLGPIWVEVASE